MLAAVFFLLWPFAGAAEDVDPKLFQSMEWRGIGPFRGGRSNASVGVIQDAQTFYFGGVGGGVWKTTDGGENWTNITDGQLKTASVGAIAVAPSDPNVIYVGMGEHAIRGVMTSHGDGVYKSTDAGRPGRHVGLPRSRAISRIRVHPTNPDLVYVAAQGAPYGPTRSAASIARPTAGPPGRKVLYVNQTPALPIWPWIRPTRASSTRRCGITCARPGRCGAAVPAAASTSPPTGATLASSMSGLPESIGKIGIDVSANPDRIYAVVEADPKGGLYRSDDGAQDVAAGERRVGHSHARLVLHEGHRRSEEPGRRVGDERRRQPSRSTAARPSRTSACLTATTTVSGSTRRSRTSSSNSNDGGANVSFNGGRTWSTQQNQPTAQFYRVNTDNLFPYSVYGGQQDNTSVKIASRRSTRGITWKDWYPVGGCESAVPRLRSRTSPSVSTPAATWASSASSTPARSRSATSWPVRRCPRRCRPAT